MNKIEAIFYIEGLSNDRKALENSLEDIKKELENEKLVKVENINVEKVIEGDDELLKYSGVIEAKVSGDFAGITRAVLKYGPAVVEVLSPGRLEIEGKELMKILGEVSLVMGRLMNMYGSLAAYPDLSEVPKPRIGYSRDEIEELITGDRHIRYRFVIEVTGKDEESVKDVMAKALALEGCKINSLLLQGKTGEKGFEGLLAAELLSTFETMFQLTAKYAPVAISIVEPEIVDVTATELQNSLTDLGGFVNELVTRPLRKRLLSKRE